jgi:hypothetical protein
MFVRFQFASTVFAEMVRDQLARSDVGCIPPTGGGFVVERIEFPPAGPMPMDVDQTGSLVLDPDIGFTSRPSRRSMAGGPSASGPGAVSLRARPDIDVDIDVEPDLDGGATEPGTVPIRVPIHVLDTIFGQGFETIAVPVDNGPNIEVRRRRLLLTLPATLSIRTLDDMIAGTGTPLVVTIALQLRVDLVHGADGKDRLRVAFHGVGHHEGTDPFLEGIIRTELAGTDTSREVEFDYGSSVLEAVAAMGGGESTATVGWSGMSLSPDRRLVELRLEVRLDGHAGSSFPDEWRQFLTRQGIDDFRTGHDWAVELTADLLDAVTTIGARKQIDEMADDFDLAGTGPHVEWRPDFPGFRTKFTGEAIDACSCFGVDIDINVAVEVKTILRLAVGGAEPMIEVDSVTSHDPTHAGEQFCCGVTAVAFWPILGWKYLAEGKIGWGGLALGMFVPIAGALYTMKKLFDPNPSDGGPAEGCRVEGDHQICSHPVTLGAAPTSPCDQPASTITIDSLRGRNNGLVLAGAVQQRVASAPHFVVSKPTPFEWQGPRPTCSGPVGEWSAVSDFEIAQVDGGYPLVIGELLGVSWTGGLYKPGISSQTECPTIAHARVGTLPYEPGNPFGGSILVLTNVGAHMVTVPSVPPLTPEEKQAHERFVARWQTRFCNVFDLDLLSSGGRMAVRWLVDEQDDHDEQDGYGGGRRQPVPQAEGDRRLWVVRAFGLDPSTVLVVDDPEDPFEARGDGEALAEAVGVAGRATRLDVLHDGDQLDVALRGQDGRPASAGEGVHVSVSQLVLREVGARRLAAPAKDIRVSGPSSSPVLEADLEDGAQVVGLGDRGRLATARRTAWYAPVRAVRPPVDGGPTAARTAYRRAQEPVRYRDRPWTDGLAFAGGGLWARLDDDRQTVRTYQVVDSFIL